MREIKFRAKAVECLEYPCMEKGQWVYGHSLRQYESGRIEIDGVYCDPRTFGQYVGAKDKHGKEIYEGDIVRCRGFYRYVYVKYGMAQFAPIPFCDIIAYDKGVEKYDCEVVGTISDNLDLLKIKI